MAADFFTPLADNAAFLEQGFTMADLGDASDTYFLGKLDRYVSKNPSIDVPGLSAACELHEPELAGIVLRAFLADEADAVESEMINDGTILSPRSEGMRQKRRSEYVKAVKRTRARIALLALQRDEQMRLGQSMLDDMIVTDKKSPDQIAQENSEAAWNSRQVNGPEFKAF